MGHLRTGAAGCRFVGIVFLVAAAGIAGGLGSLPSCTAFGESTSDADAVTDASLPTPKGDGGDGGAPGDGGRLQGVDCPTPLVFSDPFDTLSATWTQDGPVADGGALVARSNATDAGGETISRTVTLPVQSTVVCVVIRAKLAFDRAHLGQAYVTAAELEVTPQINATKPMFLGLVVDSTGVFTNVEPSPPANVRYTNDTATMNDFATFIFRIDASANTGTAQVTVFENGLEVNAQPAPFTHVDSIVVVLGASSSAAAGEVTATFDSVDVFAR